MPGYARSLALLGQPGGSHELAATRLKQCEPTPPGYPALLSTSRGAPKASRLCGSALGFTLFQHVDRSFPSFPRKRESRDQPKAVPAALGPRFRGDDGKLRSTGKNGGKPNTAPPTHPHPGPSLEGKGGRAPNPATLFGAPAAGAEQRRSRRIKGEDCLSRAAASSAAPAGFEQRREPGAARRRTGVSFFFGYFLFGQAKYARASGAEPSA